MRALAGENRSPETLRTYTAGAEQFVSWMSAHGHTVDPVLIKRDDVRGFLADLAGSYFPATARSRFSAMRRFFNWLIEEEELDRSPMERMRGPVVPEKPTPVPTEAAVRALLSVTEGREFLERRDRAIIRLMIDCGLRRTEVASLRRSEPGAGCPVHPGPRQGRPRGHRALRSEGDGGAGPLPAGARSPSQGQRPRALHRSGGRPQARGRST